MKKSLDAYQHLRVMLVEKGISKDDLKRFDNMVSRRRFLTRTGGCSAAAMALLSLGSGTEVALHGLFGRGMIPVAWAETADTAEAIDGKSAMTIHNHRPVNGEFAPHLLNDDITPTERHFVRNNGLVPQRAKDLNPEGWTLTIDGEVGQIKSMITRPVAESKASVGENITVRGHAWAENRVDKVLISTDYGISWKKTKLTQPANKYAWYHFDSEVNFEDKGYYEIWARAIDHNGDAQPFRQPWNPNGYMGNVIHRIPVFVDV